MEENEALTMVLSYKKKSKYLVVWVSELWWIKVVLRVMAVSGNISPFYSFLTYGSKLCEQQVKTSILHDSTARNASVDKKKSCQVYDL